jgi:hypothetical protein
MSDPDNKGFAIAVGEIRTVDPFVDVPGDIAEAIG